MMLQDVMQKTVQVLEIQRLLQVEIQNGVEMLSSVHVEVQDLVGDVMEKMLQDVMRKIVQDVMQKLLHLEIQSVVCVEAQHSVQVEVQEIVKDVVQKTAQGEMMQKTIQVVVALLPLPRHPRGLRRDLSLATYLILRCNFALTDYAADWSPSGAVHLLSRLEKAEVEVVEAELGELYADASTAVHSEHYQW